jgi:hypothetical protein
MTTLVIVVLAILAGILGYVVLRNRRPRGGAALPGPVGAAGIAALRAATETPGIPEPQGPSAGRQFLLFYDEAGRLVGTRSERWPHEPAPAARLVAVGHGVGCCCPCCQGQKQSISVTLGGGAGGKKGGKKEFDEVFKRLAELEKWNDEAKKAAAEAEKAKAATPPKGGPKPAGTT